MRVLLIPSKNNYPDPEPDTTSFGQAMPYISAALKAAGHVTDGLNLNYVWCHGSAPLTLERALAEKIRDFQPDLIGVSGLAPDYFFVRDVMRFARRLAPATPVVIGGGIMTYDPEFIYDHFRPDFGVVGEGELAAVQLAEHLQGRRAVEDVASLVYRSGGRLCRNPVQAPPDLDALPWPDYEPFDFSTYLEVNNEVNNFLVHTQTHPRMLPLTVARSCPFQCTFCCHYKDAHWRSRSIDGVIEEVRHFHERYRFNILYIHDELLFVQREKGLAFSRRIADLRRQLGHDFDWGCYIRVNDAEPELLAEMAAAGCRHVGVGFESASPRILESMRKQTDPEMMRRAIRNILDSGIGLHANFILGDPAETPETIRETIDFYERHCRELMVFFYYITPYPGAQVFEVCQAKGLVTDREAYYRNVAFHKRGLNMTEMSDEEFAERTAPVTSDIFQGAPAEVKSVEISDAPTPDRNAPFELRRTFCWIRAVCPHCREDIEYHYPLLLRTDQKIVPIVHACPQCHRKLLLDLARHVEPLRSTPDEDAEIYRAAPYDAFYPFDPDHYAMPSVASPQMVGTHGDYNLIRFGQELHAVGHCLGPMDIARVPADQIQQWRAEGSWISADSVEELRAAIDARSAGPPR